MIRACLVLVLLFAAGAGAAEKPCPQPVWAVDLVAKYGFRTFDLFRGGWGRPPEVWKTQPRAVFISPERLAVYQVLEISDLPAPKPRDATGGGGRFILQVVFLDTKQGEEVRTLRLITSGLDFSGVYPTHDGRFLLRAGQVLRLYSLTFQEIASRPLPLSHDATDEGWDISVSPSGRLIYEEYNSYTRESYVTKRYLLDADTLEVIPNPRPSDVALWPEGARLFDDRPVPSGAIAGVYAPDGKWQTFDGGFSQSRDCHGVWFARVTDQLFAKYGCKQLKLFSRDGDLFWNVPVHDEVRSLLSNGVLLAVEIHRHRPDPFDLGIQSKPLRIALYEVATKSEKCSIRIAKAVSDWWRSRFYAVLPAGTLAVIQGNVLSLYRP